MPSVYQGALKRDKKAEKALAELKRQQDRIDSNVSAQGTAIRLQAAHYHKDETDRANKHAAEAAATAQKLAAESKDRDESINATVCKLDQQLQGLQGLMTEVLTAQKAPKSEVAEQEDNWASSLSDEAPPSPLVGKPPASSKENNDPENNALRDALAAKEKEIEVFKQRESQDAQRILDFEEERRRRNANGSDVMDVIPSTTILSPKAGSRNNTARGGHADRIRHGASAAEKNRRKKQESTISATPARPLRRSTRSSQANRKVAQ